MLRPAAAADVEQTWAWYESARDGLGDEFLSVLEDALARIYAEPRLDPTVHGDVRRHLLKRFPYAIFYRVLGEQPVVLACFRARPRTASFRP